MPDFDISSYNDPTANRLIAAASNDPSQSIAWAQGRQQLQQGQIKTDSDAIALGRQKLAAADEVFGAIGSDPTQANAQARIMEAVKAGSIDADTAKLGFAQLMPLGDDPKAISGWAFDHMARNATYDQKLQAMGMQAPTLVDLGDKKVGVVPQSGPKPSINVGGGPALQNGMTPGDANTPVDGPPAANGASTRITKGQFAQQQNGGAPGSGQFAAVANGGAPAPIAPQAQQRPAPPTGQGGAPPSPTLAAAQPSQGGVPVPDATQYPVVTDDMIQAAKANIDAGKGGPQDFNRVRAWMVQHNQPLPPQHARMQAEPGYAPPVAQPSAQSGGLVAPAPGAGQGAPMVVGLAPGAAQAATVDADASAKQFAGITASATNLPNMKATVSNMEAVLPQITTGPQAAAWNKVKSHANFVSELAAGKDVFDPKTIAAQDEFHNNAVKLAQQQFQQLGGTGTDGQLASASGDVPNESLSNMSNAQLLAMSKGLIDAQQARTSAAEAWKGQHGPTSYSSFVDDWNKSFSPRAFQFNYLSPADRGTMLHSMSPQEKTQLKTAYDTAVQRGWIAPQGGQK